MSKTIHDRVERLTEQIQEGKLKLERLRGQQDETRRKLKEDFGVSTVKEAKVKLEDLKAKRDGLAKKLEAKVSEIEKELNHDDAEAD